MGSSPWLACHRWVWLCLFYKWANWDPERSGDSSEIIQKGGGWSSPEFLSALQQGVKGGSSHVPEYLLRSSGTPLLLSFFLFVFIFLSLYFWFPLLFLFFGSLFLPLSFSPSPFKKNFFAFSLLLFIFGCAGSSLLPSGFLQLQWSGAIYQLQRAGFSLLWFL